MDSKIAGHKTNKVRLMRLSMAVVTDFLKCSVCSAKTVQSSHIFLMQAKCVSAFPDSFLDPGSESLVHCRFA